MKRRKFSHLAGLTAVALSTSGFIRFNGRNYEGDCETTTDILGPFYRPNSPVRDDLVIKGMPGDIVELSGTIRQKDCKTVLQQAKVELWHCSSDEVYDNDSPDYRYRGTTYSDDLGRYKFRTQMPVPYDAGGGLIRPAHFHLMISTAGYQTLVTQIYFQGDPYVEKDPWSSAAQADYRRLEVTEEGEIKKVVFDCNMNDHLQASHGSIQQLIGKYKNDNSDEVKELFEKDGLLWIKNEVFGKSYDYIGNNMFEYAGMPPGMYENLQFNLPADVSIELKITAKSGGQKERTKSFTKI